MLENECEMLKSIELKFDKYWVPINWIYALIFRGRKNGKIISDTFANKLCDVCFYFKLTLNFKDRC